MTRTLTPRDLEKLSAYLDGQLSPKDTQALEARLSQESDLIQALEDLRQTRYLLRMAPKARRQRNLTLSPEMVRKQVFISLGYQTMRLISVAASVLFVIVFVGDMLVGSVASRDVAFTGEAKYVEDAGDDGAVAMQAVAENAVDESGDMADADMDVGGEPAEAESMAVEEPIAPEEPLSGGAPETAAEKSGVDDSTAQDAEIAPTSTLAGTQPPPEETYGEGIGFAEPPDSPPHVSELSPTPDPSLFSAAPPTIPPTELAVERIELEGESDDAEHDEPVYAETESWDEAEVEEAPVEEVEVQESKEPLLNLAERILVLIALLSGGIAYLIRRRAG